jgi:outer membrane protein assembly factor BamB
MVWKYGGVDRSVPKDRWGHHPVIFGQTLTNIAVADGLVIACDSGSAHCLDAATGRVYWTHADRKLWSIQGSPLVVGGRVYVASYGGVWMFDLAREKRVLGRIGDEFWSKCSPVFANGTLYLADDQRLYAVAGDERPPGR